MPKFSVTRFDMSTAKSVSLVAGSSPLPGSFRYAIVGSESSSATKGSSITSVAGKKRLPAKPCAHDRSFHDKLAHAAHVIVDMARNSVVEGIESPPESNYEAGGTS